MVSYNVQLNTEPIENLIRDLESELRDFRTPLERSGVYMHGSINRNFKAQGRPTRWTPLSERTIAQRRRGRGAGSPQILQDRGILRASITSNVSKGSIYELKPNSLRIGTNIEYASTHQFGRGAIPNVKQRVKSHRRRVRGKTTTVRAHERTVTLPPIPARPFVLIHPEDEEAIAQIFSDWIGKIVG